jgi:Zn-dependent peptidase ImmA (M78 family)
MIIEQLNPGARVNWRDGASSGAKDNEEIQANQFAAALLMPTKLLERDSWKLVDGGIDDESALVERLSKMYDVSPQAMRFRLLNLALLDPT